MGSNDNVARVEQSETRVVAAMATTSPGFAPLNTGLRAGRT